MRKGKYTQSEDNDLGLCVLSAVLSAGADSITKEVKVA